MRTRLGILAVVVALLVSACGSDDGGGTASGDLDANPSTTVASATDCEGKTLTSPEVGVTDEEITVTVVADVDNPIKPALFEGSWNGMKAWTEYMNANGGLACRKVVVKTADSKLSGEEAKNAVAAACSNSVALVGTTALFLQDVSGMESCKDKAGKATGLLDLAVLQTEPAQQCSDVSYSILPTSTACPYTSGARKVLVSSTQYDYFKKTFPDVDLHGVFVIPKDLPSTITAAMPLIRAYNELGVPSDAEFGISGTATQPEYTQVVQAMKSKQSTLAMNILDYSGTVLMRKEAKAQGVNTVRVWTCYLQCYDKRLITEGGDAVEGQYLWLNILPMEDGEGANPTLDAFLKYNKKPDAFGMQAFAAGMLFAHAVEATMAANDGDPNSITRANLLKAVKATDEFDAGGLMPPTDIAGKVGSVCYIGMQVQDGKFVRVSPTEKGQFDCGGKHVELNFDPVKEYQG
jgi:hypothetical protein